VEEPADDGQRDDLHRRPDEQERTALRRAALAQLPPEDWPMTAATAEVTAAWNTTGQYRWAVGTVLAGIEARAAAHHKSAPGTMPGSDQEPNHAGDQSLRQ